jgi:O-antigen/teichoic acid export membrane protein
LAHGRRVSPTQHSRMTQQRRRSERIRFGFGVRLGPGSRRTGLTVADQMLSSGTNFAATLVAARLLGPAGLGRVALALAVAYGVANFTRAVVGESLLVFQGEPVVDGGIGAAAVAGVLGAGAAACVGLGGGGSLVAPLIVTALLLPALTIQDTTRYVFFREGRPAMAVASDTIWAITQGAALVLIAAVGAASPATVMLSWGAGILASAIFGLVVIRPRVTERKIREWLKISRRLSVWVAGQSILAQTGQQMTFIAVGLFVGIEVLGVVRAAQALIGPLVLFVAIFRVIALAELGRVPRTSAKLLGVALRATVMALALAGIYSGLLILGRGSVVGDVFGSQFAQQRAIVAPVALMALTFAASVGAEVGNRAAAAGRNIFLAQVVATAAGVPLIIGLARADGAAGAIWGMLGQRVVWMVVTWTSLVIVRSRLIRQEANRAHGEVA